MRDRVGILLVLVLAAVSYAPTFRAGFVWDDEFHVQGPSMRSFSGLWRVWTDHTATQQYYPLSHSAFWVQGVLWGDHPLGYHVVNLALHLLNTALVWVVLRRLQVPGAILAAGLFAVHPVQVESVAWITELKNTLSASLALSSFLAYLKFDPPSSSGVARQSRWYVLSLLLFGCALLSKTSVAVLPGVILVTYWWKRGRLNWRGDVSRMIPYVVMGVSFAMVTSWYEQNWWGATSDRVDLRGVERVLVAGRASWFYLGKLLWPTHLAFFYPRWTMNAGDAVQFLFPLGVVVTLLILWVLRNRIGRAPLAALLLFGGILLPALGFVNLYWQRYSFVCDHMQYLACIPVFALLSATIWRLLSRVPAAGALSIVLSTVILGGMGWLTWRQASKYRDLNTLYLATIDENPSCWLCHYNLAIELVKDGDVPGAIDHYKQAIAIRPHYVDAHYNLGNALARHGQPKDAAASYRQAIQYDPRHFSAHYNLGNTLRDSEQLEQAVEHYRQAALLKPDFEEPHIGIGNVLVKQGRLADAEQSFRAALRVNPQSTVARLNVAFMLAQQHLVEPAVQEFRAAALADRQVIRTIVAVANQSVDQGFLDEAIAYFDLALELNPDDIQARQGRDRAVNRKRLFSRE